MRWGALGLTCVLTLVGETGLAEPVRIIFDTDMDTDCDDAGALATLHALADAKECVILGTVVSSRYLWSVPCVEAINRYYGRGDLPIGCPKGDGASTHRGSRYAKAIAAQYKTRLTNNSDAPDAAHVYRKLLAAQPDRSVVIVTVGYLTNLRDLLLTGPDKESNLSGTDLVKRKVKLWVCMGGRYPKHLDPGEFGNFKPDARSAVFVVRDWPGMVVFSGLGEEIQTGRCLPQTPAQNPVRQVYKLFLRGKPTRSSWDQVAVLYAVRPKEPFWMIHRGGHNHIFPNGTNEWRDAPDRDHLQLRLQPGTRPQVTQMIETLMCQSPTAGTR